MTHGRERRRCQVCVSLDRQVLERLEAIAEAERRPMSQLLRVVIDDWSSGRQPRIEVDAA